MTIRILLSRDGKYALISDQDAPRVLAHTWSCHGNDYACTSFYVTLPDGNKKRCKVLLHRFVVDATPDMEVDHKDRNGLNCQRHNLRIATRSQNMANTGSRKGSACGYKGIYFRRDRGTYRAEITINGRKRYIGDFKRAALAALAYNNFAREA